MALSFFGRKSPGSVKSVQHGPSAEVGEGALLPPPTELSELDFSSSDAGRGLATAAGEVEVREAVSGIGAVFEEAAVLYANGNVGNVKGMFVTVADANLFPLT